MFCSECGTKNKKDSAFCSECGHKLVSEEVKETKKTSKKVEKEEKTTKETNTVEKKPMSKKSKITLFLVIVLVAAGIFGYKYFEGLASPKQVAKDYIKATINNDANKLYKYLGLKGDKTFVTKKIFADIMKESNDKTDVTDFKIVEVIKEEDIATVRFVYTTKDSKNEQKGTIKLQKTDGKEYFFFDKWTIANLDSKSAVVEDFIVRAPKDSEVYYAGVKVTSKYLDKDSDSDLYDVYKLPQVFKYETKVVAKTSDGLEIENKVTPSSYYNEITIKMDKNSISEEMKTKILKTSKEVLTNIYESAIARKEATDVLAEYKHKGIDLDDLEDDYKSLVSELTRAVYELTDIKFKELSIYALDINDDGDFEVEVKANFDYTVSYIVTGGETKTSSKSTYSYMTLVFKYENGKFYIKDLESLKTYFSRY